MERVATRHSPRNTGAGSTRDARPQRAQGFRPARPLPPGASTIGKRIHRGVGSDAENSLPRTLASTTPTYPNDAADKREEQLLGDEKCADSAMARAQRLHQADFGAALDHRGRGSRPDGQRGRKQRRNRHQPHQPPTRVRMRPSPSATWRIARTSTPGSTCCIW